MLFSAITMLRFYYINMLSLLSQKCVVITQLNHNITILAFHSQFSLCYQNAPFLNNNVPLNHHNDTL